MDALPLADRNEAEADTYRCTNADTDQRGLEVGPTFTRAIRRRSRPDESTRKEPHNGEEQDPTANHVFAAIYFHGVQCDER